MKVTSKKTFTVELNQEEVETLMSVLVCIAGHDKNSPRKHVNELFEELSRETGINYRDTEAYRLMTAGSHIHFNDYSR